jgi:hypothetical protein
MIVILVWECLMQLAKTILSTLTVYQQKLMILAVTVSLGCVAFNYTSVADYLDD